MTLPPPVDYIARWRALIDARREQMDAAYAAVGRTTADFWAHRAAQFRDFSRGHREDPLLRRLLQELPPDANAIDVGAGTGRHLVPLAARVRRVTAVEPSPAMLHFLRMEIEEAGLGNVDVVEGSWPEVHVEPADFVYSSHVLYPVRDIETFLRKMDASARRRCYVFLRAEQMSMDFGLWTEFHGRPLAPQPSALDAFNVLWQIGLYADLQVVDAAISFTFASVDEAVAHLAHTVVLAEDDSAARERLRGLLQERLVETEDGLAFPEVATRSAIVSWEPSGAGAAT